MEEEEEEEETLLTTKKIVCALCVLIDGVNLFLLFFHKMTHNLSPRVV